MNLDNITSHISAYTSNNQILDAANFLVHSFGLGHDNFGGFGFRQELEKNSLLLTAEGVLGGKQMVNIPKNLFDFDITLVLNLIAHEMLHVRQKAPGQVIEDKNEREFQAYYEMLFHKEFPLIPDAPNFNRKQFAEKALEYYRRMGEGSELQTKYAAYKMQIQDLLEKLV